MSAVQFYIKAPKGIEEINNRTHGLPPRARQLLILLDGKRSSIDIEAMMPEGEGALLLANLLDGGFITVMPLENAGDAIRDRTASEVERPANDAERFEMAKNFMRNTVLTFLGGMGSGVIGQIERCTDFEGLRTQYSTWRDAMELSKEGRRQLADLENRLAALLS